MDPTSQVAMWFLLWFKGLRSVSVAVISVWFKDCIFVFASGPRLTWAPSSTHRSSQKRTTSYSHRWCNLNLTGNMMCTLNVKRRNSTGTAKAGLLLVIVSFESGSRRQRSKTNFLFRINCNVLHEWSNMAWRHRPHVDFQWVEKSRMKLKKWWKEYEIVI